MKGLIITAISAASVAISAASCGASEASGELDTAALGVVERSSAATALPSATAVEVRQHTPPSPDTLLVASDWSTGEWSDGGKWGNASDEVSRLGRAAVIPGDPGLPPHKLRISVETENLSWVQMVLEGGDAPPIGQPVTIRWYERILLPDSWNLDDLTHGITLGDYNGHPLLNYWTNTDGTYRMELQVLNDFDPMYAHRGTLNKRQWYRMEWTITQERADRVRMGIHVYDLAGDEVFGPEDFTNWPWADGRTNLEDARFAFDVRPKQTTFLGWLSGLAGLDEGVVWAEYAAVAMVLGDYVGPYDAARGW